jgi:hypothetical protein
MNPRRLSADANIEGGQGYLCKIRSRSSAKLQTRRALEIRVDIVYGEMIDWVTNNIFHLS